MTGEPCQIAFYDMFLREVTLEGMNMKHSDAPEVLAGLIASGELCAAIAAKSLFGPTDNCC